MKSLILCLSLLLTPFAAKADLNVQMIKIKGDWQRNGGKVFRIQQQSDNIIKVYSCDAIKYKTQDAYCEYSKISLYQYNGSFDGFCILGERSCESGLQVSFEYSNQLLEIIDPLRVYHFSNSGAAVEFEKQ